MQKQKYNLIFSLALSFAVMFVTPSVQAANTPNTSAASPGPLVCDTEATTADIERYLRAVSLDVRGFPPSPRNTMLWTAWMKFRKRSWMNG